MQHTTSHAPPPPCSLRPFWAQWAPLGQRCALLGSLGQLCAPSGSSGPPWAPVVLPWVGRRRHADTWGSRWVRQGIHREGASTLGPTYRCRMGHQEGAPGPSHGAPIHHGPPWTSLLHRRLLIGSPCCFVLSCPIAVLFCAAVR